MAGALVAAGKLDQRVTVHSIDRFRKAIANKSYSGKDAHDTSATSEAIADVTRVPHDYLSNAMRNLARARLRRSISGNTPTSIAALAGPGTEIV